MFIASTELTLCDQIYVEMMKKENSESFRVHFSGMFISIVSLGLWQNHSVGLGYTIFPLSPTEDLFFSSYECLS